MAFLRFKADSFTPPGVGEGCLRKHYPRHTCQACAQACPVAAISFSNGVPTLDEESCIECGQCLFACPADALQALEPATRRYRGDTLVGPFSALAPSVDELQLWHHQYGIRRAELNIETHPAWALAIAGLNLRLKKLNQAVWLVVPPEASAVDLPRRHWLRVIEEEVKSGKVKAGRRALLEASGNYGNTSLSLNLADCVACGACAKACPEQALTFTDNLLEWHSANCTGCGSCAAVCLPDAITLEQQIEKHQLQKFEFLQKICTCCQRHFYTSHAEADRCHICQRRSHQMREA